MNTSHANLAKALVSGVGFCLTSSDVVNGLIPGASIATKLGAGLLNALAPGKIEKFAGEISYQRLRDQFVDPSKLNHDLENLLRDAAVRSIRFIRNLYLERLEDIHELSFVDTHFGQNPLKRAKVVLDTMERDLAHWIKDEPIQQNLLENPAPCLENITNYLFMVSGVDESETEWQELRTFFTEKLPICFELAFKEALKEDKEEIGFKAFQLWVLTEIRQSLLKNDELQEKILAEIDALKNDLVGVTTTVLKAFSEDISQLTQLLERNHAEVKNLLVRIISLLKKRGQSSEFPHFLNNPPPLGVECIGRAAELIKLQDKLSTSRRVVLLNGLGGLGKTTLAKHFVYSFHQRYQHILWVEIKDTSLSLRDAFIYDKVLVSNLGIVPISDPENDFKVLMNKLRNLLGLNLLVIDNAGTDLSQRDLRDSLPSPPNWQVLLTARQHINGYEIIPIDKLKLEPARELFSTFYPVANQPDDIDKLLLEIDYHTLAIELMAKTLAYLSGRLTIDGLIQKIQAHQLSDTSVRARIETEHSRKESSLFLHLMAAFNLTELSNDEKQLLRQLSLLPSSPYTAAQLSEWLWLETEEESHSLIDLLFTLDQKGWLKDSGQKAYTLHRLVQQIVHYQIPPTSDDAISFVLYFNKLFGDKVGGPNSNRISLLPTAIYLYNNLPQDIDPIILGRFADTLGFALEDVGKYEEAKEMFIKSLDLHIDLYGVEHVEVSISKSNLAVAYQKLGQFERAKELLTQAFQVQVDALGEHHREVAETKAKLALVHRDLGDFSMAKQMLENALQVRNSHDNEGNNGTLSIRNNLAAVYRDLGYYERSRVLFEQVLHETIQKYGEKHHEVEKVRTNLATMYSNLGQFDQARLLASQALQGLMQLYGENHPEVATTQNNLALFYRHLEQYGQAKQLYEQALKVRIKLYGEQHQDVAMTKNNLGLLHIYMKKYKLAEVLLKQALLEFTQVHGLHHPNIALVLHNQGFLHRELGKYKQAEDLFKQSMQVRLHIYGKKHPEVASIKHSLASMYRSLNKPEKARPLFEDALKIETAIYGNRHTYVADSQVYLALTYIDLKQKQLAEDLFTKAYAILVAALGPHHTKTQQVFDWLNELKKRK